MNPTVSLRRVLVFCALLAPGAGAASGEPESAAPSGGRAVRVLLTVDGTHSWDRKEPAFDSLVEEAGEFQVEKSPDLDRWLPQNVKAYGLVVIHTTGGSLSEAQARGLWGFVEAGGGLVGIHSATDSFKNSDLYWELLGGRFTGHGGGKFTVEIVDRRHPVSSGLRDFEIEDEDYQHAYHPRAGLRVLAKKKGDDRNMVWVKRVGKGRVFYIANGDNPGVFQNKGFRKLLLRGMRWAAGRRVPPPGEGEEGFTSLFDGKTLSGWEGDRKLWSAEGGLLIGRSPGINYNDFLTTEREWGDFELRLQFRLLGGQGNSGIQFRSRKIPGHVSGYQADIGDGYWGFLYDEARRNKVLVRSPAELERVLEKDGWNDYSILSQGNRTVLKVNGLTTVDYSEPDPSIARKGIIALQIHSGGPMEIQFADIRIRALDGNSPDQG